MLKKYREYLQYLVKNDRRDIFTNGTPAHATIVLTTMFENANETVLMLCNGFSPECINEEYQKAFDNFLSKLGPECINEEYQKAFDNFLSKQGKVQIMVKSDKHKDDKYFKKLLKQEKVEIRIISPGAIDEISESIGYKDCDFAVFDGKMFRLECDAKNRASIGSFNDTEIASKLTEIFLNHFKDAKILSAS